jgi:hypothetical protein
VELPSGDALIWQSGRVDPPGQQQKEWRVRAWIRTAGVLVVALLAVMNLPSMERRLNPEGLPASDRVWGYLMLCNAVLATWLVAFRPRVRLSSDRWVEVRNPCRTSTFHADDVVAVEPSLYGVVLVLRDGRRPWTIAFQATSAWSGEPRWFDLAEAITGERPVAEVVED